MVTLSIEHGITDFKTWKAAFDRDPARRQESGVRRYRVLSPADDPKYVVIELDFDGLPEARAFLESLQRIWSQLELSPGLERSPLLAKQRPRARVLEQMLSEQY